MATGKAIPYGAYDVAQDEALVNVGITHDTAEFAVESIRRWWRLLGKRTYRRAPPVISADAGVSNGNRLRAWKLHLQRLADELACRSPSPTIPPDEQMDKIGTFFSFISMNWRAQPLVSYEAVVNLIGGTRTRSGLTVKALLDTRDYTTGRR